MCNVSLSKESASLSNRRIPEFPTLVGSDWHNLDNSFGKEHGDSVVEGHAYAWTSGKALSSLSSDNSGFMLTAHLASNYRGLEEE
jgi:hypothetical protein